MSGVDFKKMPNFFVIGAAKSGTTSLHLVLNQHPDIFMSKRKEPNFFNTEDNFKLGLYWYQKSYFNNANHYRMRGESTTNTLFWSTITAQRIQEVYQGRDVKFIASFRDPVDRAYSYYWMKVHHRLESLTFEEALACEDERMKSNREQLMRSGKGNFGYFQGGCYATMLQPFLDSFPRSSFSFFLSEDLRNDFSGTMVNLANFLGVDSNFHFKFIQSNSASIPRNEKLDQFLHKPSGLLHYLIKIFSHRFSRKMRHQIRKQFSRVNLRPQVYPTMNLETGLILRKRYLDEIERLEFILKRDLSSWKSTCKE